LNQYSSCDHAAQSQSKRIGKQTFSVNHGRHCFEAYIGGDDIIEASLFHE
jgi:hypothetical protein